jgi:hypothetical protein
MEICGRQYCALVHVSQSETVHKSTLRANAHPATYSLAAAPNRYLRAIGKRARTARQY